MARKIILAKDKSPYEFEDQGTAFQIILWIPGDIYNVPWALF